MKTAAEKVAEGNSIRVTDTEVLTTFLLCMNIDYRLKAIKVMKKKNWRMLPKGVLARSSVSAETVSERSDLKTPTSYRNKLP